ncbi:MAG: hypothetical protein ABFD96_07980, partial [Armatimonadia bacterium]
MARTEILPDGRAVLVPDDMTREEALALTGFAEYAAAPPRADETKSDFIDDIQRGIGGLLSGAGSALRDAYEPAGAWLQESGEEIIANNPADYASIEDIRGLRSLAGFGFERLMETAPQLAGAALATVVGTPAAGLAVLGGTTGVTTYGGAREAQRETGETDYLRALAAGVGAGALDMFGVGRVLPGAGKILGEVVEGGLRGAVRTGARIGAEEAGTEVAQTALERFGGLQELASPEAMRDYAFSAVSGALVGAPLGAARAAFEPAPEAAARAAPEAPIVPVIPEAPMIPLGVAPELASAPALRTIEIDRPDETGALQRTAISVLTEPDDRGNIFIRTPEGRVSSVPEPILRRMAGEYTPITPPEPEPAPGLAPEVGVAAAPTLTPGEEPGTFRAAYDVGAPQPVVPGPIASAVPEGPGAISSLPEDVTPQVTPPPPVDVTPEATPVGEPAPEVPAAIAPDVPQPVLPEPALPEPAPPAEIGVVTEAPEAAPPELPEPEPEPEPASKETPEETYVFTRERANEVAGHDPELAKGLIGKTASSGFELVAQRTQSPFYKQLAMRGAGMARAMESAGIRMPIGVTKLQGGMAGLDPLTRREAAASYVGGVTVP